MTTIWIQLLVPRCVVRHAGILRCGCLFSLYFPSLSCLLMCYLQQGATPVMLAAGKGHTGVVDLLVHKYNCSLTEVTTVSVFNVLGCQSSVGVSCLVSVSLPSFQSRDSDIWGVGLESFHSEQQGQSPLNLSFLLTRAEK